MGLWCNTIGVWESIFWLKDFLILDGLSNIVGSSQRLFAAAENIIQLLLLFKIIKDFQPMKKKARRHSFSFEMCWENRCAAKFKAFFDARAPSKLLVRGGRHRGLNSGPILISSAEYEPPFQTPPL